MERSGISVMYAINLRLLVASTALAFVANSALAHGDEDHSKDAKKPCLLYTSPSPRD